MAGVRGAGDASIEATSIGSTCTRDIYFVSACIEADTCFRNVWIRDTGVFVIGTKDTCAYASSACTEGTFAGRAYAGRAWIRDTSVGSTYAWIATFTWDAYIGSISTKSAGGDGAVKALEIYSQ